MGSGDINIAGLRMTPAEWHGLDAGLRHELLRMVMESTSWDHDAYDSYELGVDSRPSEPPQPARSPRRFARMQTKRVRFIALSQPLGA